MTAPAAVAIAAFKAAGVQPVPPVTGNDATIAALQLIIAGDQYNTISKPSEIVAAPRRKWPWNSFRVRNRRRAPRSPATRHLSCLPRQSSPPKNIKAEIFDKKIQTYAQVCTGEYTAACQKLGIEVMLPCVRRRRRA